MASRRDAAPTAALLAVLHPSPDGSDRRVEVAAAILAGDRVVACFHRDTLTRAAVRDEDENDLVADVLERTGLTEALLDFLPPDALCISHGAEPVRRALSLRRSAGDEPLVLDTAELARIAFPRLTAHTLPALEAALSLALPPVAAAPDAPPPQNASLRDCQATLALWLHMLRALGALPMPVLAAMNRLLAGHLLHPLGDVFRKLETAAHETRGHAAPERIAGLLALLGEDPPAAPARFVPDPAERTPLDPDAVAAHLGPVGEFAARLPTYEYREGQLQMAHAVVEAFNGSHHLMVEAGTGIGKSLAYLVPAVVAATTNGTPVVVSTNTKNLQAQLFEKDLPLIRRVLGIDFKAALIKGRANYLCVRKLAYLMEMAEHEFTPEEATAMLGVLAWLPATTTGDFAENAALGEPGAGFLVARLNSSAEECPGRACRHYRRCFLRKARARSLAADIVVANHAIVFSEMNLTSPVLPPHQHIVFDEAHNLEAAATQHFSVELSRGAIRYPLNRLWRAGPRRRDRGRGLIPSFRTQVSSGALGPNEALKARLLEACDAAEKAVRETPAEADRFLECLESVLARVRGRDVVRIRPELKLEDEWAAVMAEKVRLVSALAAVIKAAETLCRLLQDFEEDALPFHQDFACDLQAAIAGFRELMVEIEFVLAADDDQFVYWIERVPRQQGGVRAWGAPVNIGVRLADELYSRRECVVFCSATLSVRGSFAFLKKRLGIGRLEADRVRELQAGSPFDYSRQCAVMVPTFLPEPGERDAEYAAELGRLLADVFRLTHGRAMSLFTSYGMLKETTAVLKDALRGEPIQILAQGISGSRENITEVFRNDFESVLMGTHSFWEGVDLVGETLSCVVIARLPFPVFTDPIVEARCEQIEAEGESAFTGYSLPSAVIRFRQGFGRLIRHRNDRGIVIVADRRMIVKRYGIWFRNSLPAPTRSFPSREEFLAAIDEFMAAD